MRKPPICYACIRKRKQERPWYYRIVSVAICNARIRAKELGIPFELKRSDIVIPDKCPVFGTRFRGTRRGFFSTSLAPSIDRIKGSKGYTPDNIVIVSCRANSLKGNASAEELMKLAKFYRRL